MTPELDSKILSLARQLAKQSISMRRDLHLIPETAWQEFKTSAYLKNFLKKEKIDFKPVAGTGIVAEIKSGSGKCVAVRTDIDGLPIFEETDFKFRSTHEGRMHACGHDMHMSTISTAVQMLNRLKGEYQGTVKFFYQPAEEEPPGGAIAMIKAGVLDSPRVEMIFGLHVQPSLVAGKIGVRDGEYCAAVLDFDVEITGVGGHGAYPHLTIDPILCASQVIVALQSIVARNTEPFEPAVVTIGKIEAGSARNVIPPSCKLYGTARALNEKTLAQLKRQIERIIKNTVKAYGCKTSIVYYDGYPALVNRPEANKFIVKATKDLYGAKAVVNFKKPSMGGEDFARFLEVVPGAMFWLGVRNESIEATYGLHHPKFKADESAISVGAAVLTKSVIDFLNA